MINKKDIPVIEPKDVIIGDPEAPVSLVEFADYETVAAIEAHKIVKEILQLYHGKVKFIFRHFPLVRVHQKAHKAAEAAIAAAQTGKFWEMHETLLHNYRHLGTISLKLYAKDIGISDKGFLNDLIDSRYGWFVQDDLKEGIRLGVKEIPAFFINGKKMEGPVSLQNMKAKIEAAVRQSKKENIARLRA